MGCRVQKMVSSRDADFMLSLDGVLFSWGKNTDLIQRPEIKDKTDSEVPGQSKIFVSRRIKDIMSDYGKNKDISFEMRQTIIREITVNKQKVYKRGKDIDEKLSEESKFLYDLYDQYEKKELNGEEKSF